LFKWPYYHDGGLSHDDANALTAGARRPLDEIRQILLANSVQSHAKVLAQFNLDALGILSITVTRVSPEVLLQSQDIDEARKDLHRALQVIVESSLDARFKSLFSKLIGTAVAALNEYDIFGPDSVAEAIGILMARGVGIQQQAPKDQAGRIRNALSIIGNVLSIAYRGFQVHNALSGHEVSKLLPGSTADP
jgi:hypothetical protein